MKYYAHLTAALIALLTLNQEALSAMTPFGFSPLLVDKGVKADIADQLNISIWDSLEANTEFNLGLQEDELLFTVSNNVGIRSSVSEIYFDDGLLGPSVVANSLSGYTNFTGGGARPRNLPGGLLVGFFATHEFSADAQGHPNLGVDSSEDLVGVILGLGSYSNYEDVVNAVSNGELKFGLRLRAIEGKLLGASFINNPTPIPVPAAAWFFALAIAGLSSSKLRARK